MTQPPSGGYARLASLMTKHKEVAVFQRFDFLNTLDLLYMQAELVHLEREIRESMQRDVEAGQRLAERTSMRDDAGNVDRVGRRGVEIKSVSVDADEKSGVVEDEGKVRESMQRDVAAGQWLSSRTSMTDNETRGESKRISGESAIEVVDIDVYEKSAMVEIEGLDVDEKVAGIGLDGVNLDKKSAVIDDERRSVGTTETSKSEIEDIIEGARDWWYLSHAERSETWELMLKAREKLKEYSMHSPLTNIPRSVSQKDIH